VFGVFHTRAPIVQRLDDGIKRTIHFAQFGGHQRVRGVEAVTDVVDACNGGEGKQLGR
jgi:hypothetical protein